MGVAAIGAVLSGLFMGPYDFTGSVASNLHTRIMLVNQLLGMRVPVCPGENSQCDVPPPANTYTARRGA